MPQNNQAQHKEGRWGPPLVLSFLIVLYDWKVGEFVIERNDYIRRLNFPSESVGGTIPIQNQTVSVPTIFVLVGVPFVCVLAK